MEINVNVVSPDRIKTQVRRAYKILRPGGRDYGMAAVIFYPHNKINGMRGWCIPAQGKDYEIRDKEAVEVSPPGVAGGELVSDVKAKVLQIPAADPGNIVGYEYEKEEQDEYNNWGKVGRMLYKFNKMLGIEEVE